MKILHVNKFFDLHGGAEVYMHELMKRQEAAGHEVHALSTRSPKNLPSVDTSRFVTRYNLDKSDGAATDFKKAMNFLWNREAKRAMTEALREIKPDVVHLHNIYHHLSSSLLSPIRRSGIRCVQTLHDLKLACPNYKMYTEGAMCERCKGGRYYEAIKHQCLGTSFLPNMLAALEMGMTKARQSYEKTVSMFICPSQFMADKMIEWGEPASKFTVVRMPVERHEASPRGGGYLFAAGRLSVDKGYAQLVRAAARVPGIRIKIAGTGPIEEELRALARSEGGAVEFVGFKRGEELASLFRGAEALLASPIGYENAPLAVLEAVSYGLPILATDTGGIPEMVHDGKNGFLVERGSLDGWVSAFKRFEAMTAAERNQMSAESLRISNETYPTWSEHVELVTKWYRNDAT